MTEDVAPVEAETGDQLDKADRPAENGSVAVAGRRYALVASFVTMRRAHAVSSAAVFGVQTNTLRRLGESTACVAWNGPSMRMVPMCGKNV